MLGCLGCDFADKEKLEQMKKFHEQKDWVNCGNVFGSCNYPYKLDVKFNDDGTMTCNTKEIDKDGR